MNENPESISQLLARMESLLKRQELFSREIEALRGEIYRLKAAGELKKSSGQEENEIEKISNENLAGGNTFDYRARPVRTWDANPPQAAAKTSKPVKISMDLEKFIGENLINKIGILITVIGVSIGAKYSFEHDLISPMMRIVLGYFMGLSLLGIGLKLKNKYKNYSAVLVSGAMAILYFVTYAAYTIYQLMPQGLTFALMVIFTVFTVYAALNYNKQVIAHIGLAGAYAVPFLLSDDSGHVIILFSYMSIINVGILVISFIKYWKPVFYSSFLITWLIYYSWFNLSYQTNQHFEIALSFLTVFFLIFYISFLAYKLRKNEKFGNEDILLLLTNSFLFYGIGYSILNNPETGKQLTGLFTVCNAVIHFIVSVVIYRKKLADRNLYHLILGLGLVFITLAIPVQLDGNWVTLLWAGEAAILFWIGRTRSEPVYEILSYGLIFLAFVSILQDWGSGPYLKQPLGEIVPLFNINFLTSLLVLASFGFISFLNQKIQRPAAVNIQKEILKISAYAIPAIFLFTLYYSFRMEIASYFQHLFADSSVEITAEGKRFPEIYTNSDLLQFKSIWINIYSMLFLALLSLVNIRKLRNQQLGFINLGLNVLAILVFLIADLYLFSELRETYLDQTLASYYPRGFIYIGIRYLSMAFVAGLFLTTSRYIRQEFLKTDLKIYFDLLLYISIVWIASSELIHWMDMADSSQSYKLGLSILWGVCALLLISLGIWKKKKHLRIAAIALFAVTLLKLFFYDISYLDTISKTIVFVSLGILLLIISFLYNKYRHLISEEVNIPGE